MKHKQKLAQELWHSFSDEEIFQELETSKSGLNQLEVQKRLDFYGLNKLPEGKKITIWQIILHQLLNPLIFILIAAALASFAIGEGKDAIFIFLVILINTSLGTYQEYNAEKSALALQNLIKIKARVLRNQKEIEIISEEIVPGDIVLLESGMKVPADMKLIETYNLEIDESFLTGESIPAIKNVGVLSKELGVAERSNMAFAGSTVQKGRGLGVVVCTGVDTQVGMISQNVFESKSAKPPLVQRMEKFIKQITFFILVLSIILAIILRLKGMDYTAIFFFVVALSVSAIPEGLPVALTVALSIASKRMAQRNVIVRRLNAVESLGSCTVIASDKTGTLTVNEQTAKIILLPNATQYFIDGQGYNGEGVVRNIDNRNVEYSENKELNEISHIALFANEAKLDNDSNKWTYHGDPMDVALLGMCYKLGTKQQQSTRNEKLIAQIPYESERKYSACFTSLDDIVFIGLKGAVETILDFCQYMSVDGQEINIDKEKILENAEQLAKQGYRVLAFAAGQFSNFQKKELYENKDIPKLTFYGLVGFIDPLRPQSKESVKKCQQAGIKVIMITGDHPQTAKTIAKELGIADDNSTVVTGQMLSDEGASDSPAFEKLVACSNVFARVSPTQKLEIVDVLIRDGEFVAVTGDGVNDAPALKRANIGVAMGSGTDVAKEVGSLIIVDDNFTSIVAGVEEGRFAYDNVRKVIYLLISTGAAEIILFLASIFAGLPLPLLAVQLLWLNLVTNGIQDVALAFEGGEPGAMKRKPRKTNEKIFNPLMIKQTVVSGLAMAAVAFGIWYWLNNYTQLSEFSARNIVLLSVVFMQNFHVFNCRSEFSSVFRTPLKRNIILVFGVIVAQGIHVLSMQIPFMQNILRIEPVSFTTWLYVLAFGSIIILVMEIFKLFLNKKQY